MMVEKWQSEEDSRKKFSTTDWHRLAPPGHSVPRSRPRHDQVKIHEEAPAEVVMFVPLLPFFFVLPLPAIRDLVPGISVRTSILGVGTSLQYIQHAAGAAAAAALRSSSPSHSFGHTATGCS